VNIWLLRVAWVTLPLTGGPAAADALAPWDGAPRATLEVLLWSAWAVVLLATLVPRPVSLTIVRTGAPLAFAGALLAVWTGRPSGAAAVVAVLASGAAAVLAGTGRIARACAQGAAYGDEERFPLKVPPALFLGVLPLAVLLVGAGATVGPVWLADGRTAAGVVAVAVGVPLAALLARSLHLLSRRWVVLVPAGLVVADPMTLTDPVLFPREHVLGLGPADARRRAGPEALDLRLGAATGSCALLLDEDVDLYRRTRRAAAGVRSHLLLFSAVAAPVLLSRAAARRIRVRNAD
jgi:hypothetical protein